MVLARAVAFDDPTPDLRNRAESWAARIPGARTLADGRVVVGWIEVAAVVLVVVVYLAMPHGDPHAHLAAATAHARDLAILERGLGLRWEPALQRHALHVPVLVDAANLYYGSLHFIVTAAAFAWLFRRHPDDYPDWRNGFAATSVLALVVFALWPVLPPRLSVGAGGIHLQDTLTTHASLWSFTGPMGSVANQLAAMPSVHCAWAAIVAAVVAPRAAHRGVRLAAVAHPIVTAWVVVVTGNHYVLDVAGGFGVAALGWWLARAGHRWIGSRAAGVRRSGARLPAFDGDGRPPRSGLRLRR